MANNNKHTGPNVPALRFPEFSGEWEQHSLSDYLRFKNGLNPDAKRFGKGIKFISVMDILNNASISYDCVRASVAATEQEISDFEVEYGDVLFQRSSETLEDIGRSNIYVDSRHCVFGGFVIRGKKIGEYEPYFMKYMLDSPYARKSIIVKGAGAQHFNIGQDGLSKVELFFPKYEEQVKIGDLLRIIDDRINTQSKIIEELTTLRSALIEKCAKQSGNFYSLTDILQEMEERSTAPNQYQVLSSTVKGIFSQKEYFNKDIASEDNKGYKVVRKGHIVLSPQNLWMGNINYNDRFDIGIVSPSYKVFSIKEGFNPIFIAAILQTKKALNEYMLASEQGASIVRRNLNIEAFMAIKFRIPDARQQDSLSMAITAINAKLNNERCYLEQLTLQKSSLLENMFI